MKLERIILENFRQYFGSQRMDFAKDRQRNVTVIHGINGAGKTSLFLALNWCLYGRNVENIKIIDNVGELVSKEAINRAKQGDVVRTAVTVNFLHNGERYMVKRILAGSKLPNGTLMVNEMDQFTMMRTGADGQAEPVLNPLGTMNAILPVNAREYFFFDGEKIDNFAKPEATEQIKQAIYLVLKLEILERARRHLENTAQSYRKELKHASGKILRQLLEKDEKFRETREKAINRKGELEQEILSAKRKIEDINHRLRDSQNAKALQQQRDRIDRDLTQRRKELKERVEEVRLKATEAYFMLGQLPINRALALLNEKRERGEIPSNIRQQFISDLLEQMQCICGRSFEKHGPEHARLLSIMHSAIPGSLEDEVLDTSALLRTFADRNAEQRTSIDNLMKQRAELINRIQDLDAEVDDVGRQLRGSPLEEISKLERQRQDFQADIDKNNLDIGMLTEQSDDLAKEIADLEKEINLARKEEKRERELSIKLELAQKSADAIGDMYQVFADDMRERIQIKTKEIFKKLVWKESHFQDVRLGPDFNLEVIDRYDQPARPELSAGERQVLSLAFITGMALVSEEEAPLVMDTPFGRLSSQPRNNITEQLPKLVHQLILFVTDEELRDQARQNLQPHIGAEYRLSFNDNTSCTTIEEEQNG